MKSKTVRPPTPKAITLAIQHLQEQINKRLASKYLKASTKSSLLRNADTLCKIANKIYSALGVEACATWGIAKLASRWMCTLIWDSKMPLQSFTAWKKCRTPVRK